MTLAIILGGGLGSRLRRVPAAGPKSLLVIGGRPLVEWSIERFARAGLTRIAVVTRPDVMAMMREIAARWAYDAVVSVIEQREPSGTLDALQAGLAGAWDGASRVWVLLGDNVPPVEALRASASHSGPNALLFARRAKRSGSSMCIVRNEVGTPVGLTRCDARLDAEICPGLYSYPSVLVRWLVGLSRPPGLAEWSLDLANEELLAGGRADVAQTRYPWVHVNEEGDLDDAREVLVDTRDRPGTLR